MVDTPESPGGDGELTPRTRYHAVFAALVCAFLVLGVWVTAREFLPEYRTHQTEFADRLSALAAEAGPESPALPRLERGVRQVLLEGYTKADRCAAWLAEKLREPRLGVEDEPLMPRIRLTPEERGAVAVALLSLRGDAPPKELQMAAPDTPEFAPQGEFGRLIQRYRCFSCHRMRGRGGNIPQAPLDAEGSLARTEWIFSYLKLPYTIRPLITPYRLAARERTALLGLFGPGRGDRPAPDFSPAREPREGDLSRARALLPRIRPATGGADPLLVWR